MRYLTFVHLLALATWFGAMVFWTFAATPKIFAEHERRAAGDIVGLIFPRYYTLGTACAVVAFLTALALPGRGLIFPLAVLLIGSVYAGTILRGRIVEAKQARRRLEEQDDPDARAVAARFGRLHGLSMAMNLGLIVGVAFVFWRWAARLGEMS